MEYNCSKCKKDLGGYLTGKWRSIKGQKYCLDCANKVEGKEEQGGEQCPECKKNLGGFFIGNQGYYKNIKYCSSCLKKKKNKGKDNDKDVISEDVCFQCQGDLGGFFGKWKIYKGKKYCLKCVKANKNREELIEMEEERERQNIVNSKLSKNKMKKPLLEFKGGNGRVELYEHYVRLDRGTVLGFLHHGLKGQKDIYFDKIGSIQLKKPGFTRGYMQFSIVGGNESEAGIIGSTRDENTITFVNSNQYEIALKIKEYIENSRHLESRTEVSIASEIEKLAGLRDKGILTESEFKEKKKKLLDKL